METSTNRVEIGMCTASEKKAMGRGMLVQLPSNPVPPRVRSNRASKEEFQLRVSYVVQMLLDGRPKYQIKAFFRSQYGLKSRQVERHLRLARARLAESTGVDLAQLCAEFYERYLRVYREAESDAVKINALRAASDLFGLNAPLKTAHTTSKSTDMNLAREAVKGFTVEELRALRGRATRCGR